MGRKEVRTFLKRFSRVTAYTGGDVVRKAEANTKGSKVHYSTAYADTKRKARTRRACQVREHGKEKVKSQELGNPVCSLSMQVGLFNKTKKV